MPVRNFKQKVEIVIYFELTNNIHVDVLHASKQKTAAMDLLFTIGEHRILYAMSSSDEVEEKVFTHSLLPM